MDDSPKIARRRMRKKRTVSLMIGMYCKGMGHADRTHQLYCGSLACAECAELDAYALVRTEGCRQMANKVTCEECGRHCYAPAMREKVRAAMRYAGPRMIFTHPIAAVRHVLFNE